MTTPPDTPSRSEPPAEPAVERKGRSSAATAHVHSDSRQALAARVRRAQQGDLHALDALVRSFQRMAIGYAASLLGMRIARRMWHRRRSSR
jgi:hypothetical protein